MSAHVVPAGSRAWPWPAGALLTLCIVILCGCEQARQDMYDQPRYKAFTRGEVFADGNSAQTPPDGTEPRASGPFAGTSSGRLGADEVARARVAARADADPEPLTLARLARGRERYQIYCMPCHSPVGDGDGLVVRRGFPQPPSFHIERLRQAPDRQLFDVITDGHGVMPSYAGQVRPDDRWAIVAYLRALQLSQHVVAGEVPPRALRQLDTQPGEGP